MSRKVGMSAELEAIMKYRRAKCTTNDDDAAVSKANTTNNGQPQPQSTPPPSSPSPSLKSIVRNSLSNTPPPPSSSTRKTTTPPPPPPPPIENTTEAPPLRTSFSGDTTSTAPFVPKQSIFPKEPPNLKTSFSGDATSTIPFVPKSTFPKNIEPPVVQEALSKPFDEHTPVPSFDSLPSYTTSHDANFGFPVSPRKSPRALTMTNNNRKSKATSLTNAFEDTDTNLGFPSSSTISSQRKSTFTNNTSKSTTNDGAFTSFPSFPQSSTVNTNKAPTAVEESTYESFPSFPQTTESPKLTKESLEENTFENFPSFAQPDALASSNAAEDETVPTFPYNTGGGVNSEPILSNIQSRIQALDNAFVRETKSVAEDLNKSHTPLLNLLNQSSTASKESPTVWETDWDTKKDWSTTTDKVMNNTSGVWGKDGIAWDSEKPLEFAPADTEQNEQEQVNNDESSLLSVSSDEGDKDESLLLQQETNYQSLKDGPLEGTLGIAQKTIHTTTTTSSSAVLPVSINPVTNNVIQCSHDTKGTWRINELLLENHQSSIVLSTVVSLIELNSKWNSGVIVGIADITNISAGVHRQGGRLRVRVAAMVNLLVLQQSQQQTVVVVWQWGYGPNQPITLQSVVSPPLSSNYDCHSFVIADGLVFLGGTTTNNNQAVVHLGKPNVRDTWLTTIVSTSNETTVTCLTVITFVQRNYKYLAVSLSDGSVSVWTYEVAATTNRTTTGGNEQALQPLCTLLQPAVNDDDTISICTHLTWMPPRSPGPSSILLLAAVFNNRTVAIYNVVLPLCRQLTNEKEGEATTNKNPLSPIPRLNQLNEVVELVPIAISTTTEEQEIAVETCCVAWINLGPIVPPYLMLVSKCGNSLHVSMATLNLPLYDRIRSIDEVTTDATLEILCNGQFPIQSSSLSSLQLNVFSFGSLGSVFCHCNGNLMLLYPTLGEASLLQHATTGVPNPQFLSLTHAVTSTPLGIDDTGFVVSSSDKGNKNNYDDILHVHSNLHCQIQEQQQGTTTSQTVDTDEGDNQRVDWGIPTMRHWLCKSMVGDKKKVEPKLQQQQTQEVVEFPTGGAETTVICEITTCGAADCFSLQQQQQQPLTPYRISRDHTGDYCTVLFRPIFCCSKEKDKPAQVGVHPVVFALLDLTDSFKKAFTLRHGRDVTFITRLQDRSRLLSLKVNENSIEEVFITDNKDISRNSQDAFVNEVKIFAKGSKDEGRIDVHRLIATLSNRIFFVGLHKWKGVYCLFSGGEWSDHSILSPSFLKGKVPKLLLNKGERFLSLVELGAKDQSNVAVATTSRVFIMTYNLNIIAEVASLLTCVSLSPIGSYCVAYFEYLSVSRTSGGARMKYLSCLPQDNQKFFTKVIATLPPTRYSYASYLLLAIRPDRFLYLSSQSGSRLASNDQEEQTFLSIIPLTRPILLLEPLVANALCHEVDRRKWGMVGSIIEKFGRKSQSNPHSDKEGIGTLGAGISSAVYKMLSDHGGSQAISYLINCHNNIDQAGSYQVLPPWIPASIKASACKTCDGVLQAISSGDHYLTDYLQNPCDSKACMMPRSIDPSSVLSQKYAASALNEGKIQEALRYLDFSGSPSSENDLVHIILSMQLTSHGDIENILERLCGKGTGSGSECHGSTTIMSTIALALKQNQKSFCKQIASQLAPSFQKGRCATGRPRNRLLGKLDLGLEYEEEAKSVEQNFKWKGPLDESNNIWSTGPFNSKEEILLLDRIEEWVGRVKPAKLGKVGAEIAAESGRTKLLNILAAAARDREGNKSPFGDEEDSNDSFKEGWIDGVGQGRSDEDNLTLYLRFSEGADEDSNWKTDGLNDLSSYHNNTNLIQADLMDIEATTSYVDEGESGKVKLLHDLVFNRSIDEDELSGIMVEVKRGSSLDSGMLHSSLQEARHRSTIEFWYFLPSNSASREIVLTKRSICFPGEALENLCSTVERQSLLWEIVVLPSGRLQFRTCGGSSFDSTPSKTEKPGSHEDKAIDRDDSSEYSESDYGFVSRRSDDGHGGWNHLCLTFSCRDVESFTHCNISLMMKGVLVCSSLVRVEPPGLEKEDLLDIDCINETLERSALMFGLGATAGVRITDIRCWACARSVSDVKMMMYECLNAAETKKKIRVKILNKSIQTTGKTGFLLPPQTTISKNTPYFAPPPVRSTRRQGYTSSDIGGSGESMPQTSFFPAFELSEDSGTNILNSSELKKNEDQDRNLLLQSQSKSENVNKGKSLFPDPPLMFESEDSEAEPTDAFTSSAFASDSLSMVEEVMETKKSLSNDFVKIQCNWLLSKEVRNSAAAALVRGPPATRHFGGNRGGLTPQQFSSNIGSIAICGSEKTVIFTHEKTPPGKTYQIGASGAIISDVMDDESEFLCCFLAKDKRMVVFELNSKILVAQLQMTTKLNFWRFLPPVAHGDTLVFMLITPIGGFHWMPLDEVPRPRQAWKRTSELQGRKVLTYEEGGSNGLKGEERRSSIALLLTTSASTNKDPVEAWCLRMFGNPSNSCLKVSSDALGAALFCSLSDGNSLESSFDPFLVLVSRGEDGSDFVAVKMFELSLANTTKTLHKGPLYAWTKLDCSRYADTYIPEPAMAMGTLPETFCMCCGEYIVVILRSKGVLFALTRINNELSIICEKELNQYVVEAAIRHGKDNNQTVEVVTLLSETDNLKDGRIVTIEISQPKTSTVEL